MRNQRGVAAIEFALVLPVMLTLAFAIMDWSLFMVEQLNVGVVANRSMRLAAGDEDPAGRAIEAICADLPAYSLACADADIDAIVTDRGSGQVLELTIAIPFDPPVGLIPTPEKLTASVTTSWYGEEG